MPVAAPAGKADVQPGRARKGSSGDPRESRGVGVGPQSGVGPLRAHLRSTKTCVSPSESQGVKRH